MLLGIVLSLVLCSPVMAQPTKSPPKTLINYGVSGLYLYEVALVPIKYVSTGESDLYPFFSIWNTSYSFRRSLYSFNDHSSIGILAAPSLALINDGYNFFDLKAETPITVGFNWGAAATHKSISTRGFAWHFGVNIMKAPILNSLTAPILSTAEVSAKPQLMFCSSIHFRRWTTRYNDDGECREVELFFGVGPKAMGAEPLSLEFIDFNRSFRASIHFRRFLNY